MDRINGSVHLPSQTRIFELTFSREALPFTLQVWDLAEGKRFCDCVGFSFPENGYQFFEIVDGLGKNYVDMAFVRQVYDYMVERVLQDQRFFDRIETAFWMHYGFVKGYLSLEKKIQTKPELQSFFDHVIETWATFDVCYWLVYFEKNRLPTDIFERAKKIRTVTETIIVDCGRVFHAAAQNILGQSFHSLHDYLLFDELVHQKPVLLAELEKRKNHSIFSNGKLEIVSLDAFLEKNRFELQKQVIDWSKGITGKPVFSGKAVGIVRVCLSKKELGKVQNGDILVSTMTHPDFLLAAKKAGAIVTDEGGITSHAAILARELKKPCIVGTKVATTALKDGDRIEVDANAGIVRILK